MKEAQTINTWQAIQDWWESRILDEENRTPNSRFQRTMEEIEEWQEAHMVHMDDPNNPYKSKEAAMELADVVIVGLGYIQAMGFDLENLIAEKFERNHIKYNVENNRQLREGGMSTIEAINHQKEQWNLQREIEKEQNSIPS